MDITESKKAEEALKRSERKYREFADSLPEIAFEVDEKGNVTFFNQRAFEILGYSQEDFKSLNIFQFLIPEDRVRAKENIQKILKGGKSRSSEYTLLRKDGSTFPALALSNRIISDDEKGGVRGVIIDISEQKNTEEKLRESEEKFRTLAERSPNMIFINQKGRVVYVNEEAENIMGYKKEEFCSPSFNFLDLVAQESKESGKSSFSDHMKGENVPPCEYRLVTKEGRIIEAIISSRMIKYRGESAILGVVTDITERKKVEEALRESDEKFRLVVDSANDAIITVDDEGKIVLWNRAAETIFGYSANEAIGKSIALLIPPRAREREIELLSQRLKVRDPSLIGKKFEIVVVGKNRSEFPAELSFSTWKTKSGNLSTGIIRDITERKRAEESLRESEERFRLAFENAKDAIFWADAKTGLIINCNKAAETLLDKRREEILGYHQTTLHPRQKAESYTGMFKRHIEEKGAVNDEAEVITRSGKIKPVQVTASVTVIGGKPIIQGIFRDVAEHKRAEQAVRDSREGYLSISKKLESLMKSSAVMLHTSDLRERLATIAEAVCEQGWKRTVITLKDENLETTEIVTAGLTNEEEEHLRSHQPPGEVWRKRLGSIFEKYRLGEFYYLPWSDPLVQEQFKHAVPSKMKKEETIDWNPDDLLYIPLRLPGGRVVGIMSMDDPQDGRHPKRESLAPLELFAHQAAVAIENAKLIQQAKEYAQDLEGKVEERTKQLKETQQQLVKSERLAAIGELAAMVGHDLRNPLTGITGATYYLKTKYGPKMDSKSKEMLRLIGNDIERSNKIINDLLEYSRDIKLDLNESNPKLIVKKSLFAVEIPKKVQVVDLTRDKPKIKTDTEKMRRVFINIIKNAFDAMPNGGRLTIKSTKIGNSVAFSFSDTGIGIPKEIMEKLGSPLTTTKAKGMGFGLPICKRFVEAHGGNISAESEIGKGTTFTVIVPIEPKLEQDHDFCVNLPESPVKERAGKRISP
jgi:PAS domain S-box-containing protein